MKYDGRKWKIRHLKFKFTEKTKIIFGNILNRITGRKENNFFFEIKIILWTLSYG